MQQLDFSSYTFRFKIAKIKCLFLTKSGKFIIHTRGMGSPTCRSVLLQENILNRSLMWKVLKVNGLRKRYDVVVFNSDGSIAVLIECKAPEVKLHKPHLTKLLVTI
jgi:hypothetical protein